MTSRCLIAGHAAEHAAQRRLHARGDLVVRWPGCDAVDEAAILVAIGELQIVRETRRWRRISRTPAALEVVSCHSHACAPVIWIGPEYGTVAEPLAPNSFSPASKRPSRPKLRGRKRKVHVAGIGEVDLVVIPAVAVVGENVASPGRGRFQRVRAHHPVAQIDDVDVLLDQDVSGERAIPEPVAQPVFIGAGARMRFFSVDAGAL